MNKMCIAYLGALLLALHLISSQVVHAQITEGTNTTAVPTNGTTSSHNKTQTTTVNTPSKNNGAGRTDAFTLLLPLAVGASLLLGWS